MSTLLICQYRKRLYAGVTKTSHSWLKREKFHMWKVVDDQSSSYWLTIKMFLRRKSPVFPLTVNIVKSGADCLFTIKKCLLRFSDKLNSVVHSSEVVYLGEDEAFESCWRIFSAINYCRIPNWELSLFRWKLTTLARSSNSGDIPIRNNTNACIRLIG